MTAEAPAASQLDPPAALTSAYIAATAISPNTRLPRRHPQGPSPNTSIPPAITSLASWGCSAFGSFPSGASW